MRKHPKFNVPNYGRKKRIKIRWRRPRGIDSKKKIEIKYMGAVPKIGWRGAKKERGLHPSGLREVLISSPKELDKIGGGVLVRISSRVGKRKRKEITAKASSLGLKVV